MSNADHVLKYNGRDITTLSHEEIVAALERLYGDWSALMSQAGSPIKELSREVLLDDWRTLHSMGGVFGVNLRVASVSAKLK